MPGSGTCVPELVLVVPEVVPVEPELLLEVELEVLELVDDEVELDVLELVEDEVELEVEVEVLVVPDEVDVPVS